MANDIKKKGMQYNVMLKSKRSIENMFIVKLFPLRLIKYYCI